MATNSLLFNNGNEEIHAGQVRDQERQEQAVLLPPAVHQRPGHFIFGIVWIWTVLLAIGGFFWMATGLITLLTGAE